MPGLCDGLLPQRHFLRIVSPSPVDSRKLIYSLCHWSAYTIRSYHGSPCIKIFTVKIQTCLGMRITGVGDISPGRALAQIGAASGIQELRSLSGVSDVLAHLIVHDL